MSRGRRQPPRAPAAVGGTPKHSCSPPRPTWGCKMRMPPPSLRALFLFWFPCLPQPSQSPPPSPPQLFFPLHGAVSGFRSSPSSKASPGSTAWGRGAPKFLGFVGFGCGMGTDITEPKKMQRGLLRVGPFLSVLGSVGSKTSA